jgi:hypothetical protein
MIKFYLLFISFSLYSCFTISPQSLEYLGNSFTPTQRVDVYIDVAAIRKPYTVMGKSSYQNRTPFHVSLDTIQKMAVEKAKEKGADAILFQDYIVQNGTSIETITRTDSIGVMTPEKVRTTTATPIEIEKLDILFLKYD